MSNNRDNSPELDYFELRRRHEQYKSRARMEQSVQKLSAAEKAVRTAAPEEEQPVRREESEIIQKEQAAAEPMDAFEEAIEEGYEDYEEDYEGYDGEGYEDDEQPADNPNPFDSFINFFHGMKNSISSRRGGKHADGEEMDELEELDEFDDLDELTEEELAALEDENPAPVKRRPFLRKQAGPADDADEESEGGLDIEGGVPAGSIETDFDEENGEFIDDDFEDEDEEEAPRKSGFKKFVGLFVQRDDETEEDEEEFDDDEIDPDDEDEIDDEDSDDEDDFEDEDEEEEAPKRRGFFGRLKKKGKQEIEDDFDEEEIDEEDDMEEYVPVSRRKPEGGQKMQETNKQAAEPVRTEAPAVETSGMTRRERRELAMRLAAEEAARKAAEEAQAAPAEAAAEPVDMAAFENAPETDIIVETTAEEVSEPAVEEPTREFKPVSMRDVHEAVEKNFFDPDDEDDDFDEDEDDEDEIIEKKPRFSLFGRKRARDEDEDDEDIDDEDDDDFDDDDDEDDEDEIVEKKPRRGLFGRKRARDEDEDDEDIDDEDDDDFDEDDDDEDEIAEKKPRRGLFGRKRARDEDEDEDDEDEEEEEYADDEDEDSYDDEYDEYDNDEDDEDEYDDDEDEYDDDEEDGSRRSFGYHLIGILKAILFIIAFLSVVMIGMNFHYYLTGSNIVIETAHNVLGDSTAFEVLCFSHTMREHLVVEEEIAPEIVIEAEVTAEPTAIPAPEATAVVPNLDTNTVGEAAETEPVIDAAPVVEEPVVEEAPVQEAPVVAGAVG